MLQNPVNILPYDPLVVRQQRARYTVIAGLPGHGHVQRWCTTVGVCSPDYDYVQSRSLTCPAVAYHSQCLSWDVSLCCGRGVLGPGADFTGGKAGHVAQKIGDFSTLEIADMGEMRGAPRYPRLCLVLG